MLMLEIIGWDFLNIFPNFYLFIFFNFLSLTLKMSFSNYMLTRVSNFQTYTKDDEGTAINRQNRK